ncbi:MAG TPA: YjcZ family sporulation protein [Haloplasmataceae bacterium]
MGSCEEGGIILTVYTDFALILVLFILLAIIGCTCWGDDGWV